MNIKVAAFTVSEKSINTIFRIFFQAAFDIVCQRMKRNFDADLGSWQAVCGEIMSQINKGY